MDRIADVFVSARNLMVDGQVRPNRVYNPRLIAAMRAFPRERFVPAHLVARAYADEDVPLGGGRYLTEPMTIARLVQLAAPKEGEKGLVIAAGTGYAAALLEACGVEVTAVEDDPALLAIARPALAAVASSVVIIEAPPANGWDKGGPYDIILIDGAVEDVPDEIVEQARLVDTTRPGRIVTVQRRGPVCVGVLGERSGGGVKFNPAFDCATPLLPMFRRAAGFVF